MDKKSEKETSALPTKSQLKAAEIELCKQGCFPPNGRAIGFYCFAAFFVGSLLGMRVETGWGWTALLSLIFAASFYLGEWYDNTHERLVFNLAKEKLRRTIAQTISNSD